MSLPAHSLERFPPGELELVVEALLVQAALAREDIGAFFELVMKEETSHRPLLLAPHQRVLFSFVEAHPRCVLRMPAGSSKTFCMAAITLHLLGQDPTVRGAVVSATQDQAKKVVSMVADYIETPELSAALRLVFPNLRPSDRAQDPWTQTKITVNRPPGIRDPSLVAVGNKGKLPGARLKWVVVDDLLDIDNTKTPEARADIHEFFDSMVLSRLDRDPGARIIVTNTPWHPEDLTYELERAGWPTLTMDVLGNITISNVPAVEDGGWDDPAIRPSRKPGEVYRLAAHDPDPEEVATLWDVKFSPADIRELRLRHLPHRFAQLFLCQCRDEASAKCKREWIEHCKVGARARGYHGMVEVYKGRNLTVTGVDLGIGQTRAHDKTSLVTLEVFPDKRRRILEVQTGRWDGPEIVRKIIDVHKRFDSFLRVENNAAQDFILQFALERDITLPIRPHTTGRNKAHPELGIEGVFVEVKNGAWLLPNYHGRCEAPVQELIDGWLFYDPSKHTPDPVMAAWLAREEARALDGVQQLPGFATRLLAR